MSTVPGYWFYPHSSADVPGQGAYQAVWLTPARLHECPTCGDPEARVDPASIPLRSPSRAAFEGLVGSDERSPVEPTGE